MFRNGAAFLIGGESVGRNAKIESNSHLTKEQLAEKDEAAAGLQDYPKLNDEPPTWLDDEAKSEWQRVVPLLKEKTPVSELDRAQLTNHCLLMATIKTCTKEINKSGLTTMNEKTGQIKRSPYVDMRDKAYMELRSIDGQLGMTLQSRTKMELDKAKQDPTDDTFSTLLS